ncbi:MAG: o-succinylbenzoate synthase [Muribaculaceae bacterium]|nr:o-succinylbenzoate synthase [Muribaculaceae bacterium]
MRLAYAPVMLHFKQPAGTSRGILTEKPTYLLKIYDEHDPSHFGLGEASVFPGLSPEADGYYEYKLVELLANIALGKPTDLSRHSSIQLGLEEAIRDYASGCRGIYFDSPFTHGEETLTINGLVWMGNREEMLARAEEKLRGGFRCVKFKIGALDWNQEFSMLKEIRSLQDASKLEMRVDANGGFTPENVMNRLEDLATLQVHSIEQPLPRGHYKEMARVCKESPVDIALDEELIGLYTDEERLRMLDEISPRYIILKPSLCGGFSGSLDWIEKARERNIGWWITSALESNIGLNAISQFAASLNVEMPQGLGTGSLFTQNFETPLRLEGEHLSYHPELKPEREALKNLDWRE